MYHLKIILTVFPYLSYNEVCSSRSSMKCRMAAALRMAKAVPRTDSQHKKLVSWGMKRGHDDFDCNNSRYQDLLMYIYGIRPIWTLDWFYVYIYYYIKQNSETGSNKNNCMRALNVWPRAQLLTDTLWNTRTKPGFSRNLGWSEFDTQIPLLLLSTLNSWYFLMFFLPFLTENVFQIAPPMNDQSKRGTWSLLWAAAAAPPFVLTWCLTCQDIIKRLDARKSIPKQCDFFHTFCGWSQSISSYSYHIQNIPASSEKHRRSVGIKTKELATEQPKAVPGYVFRVHCDVTEIDEWRGLSDKRISEFQRSQFCQTQVFT